MLKMDGWKTKLLSSGSNGLYSEAFWFVLGRFFADFGALHCSKLRLPNRWFFGLGALLRRHGLLHSGQLGLIDVVSRNLRFW